MRKIQDIAGFFFILAVAILGVISILGVWDFFSRDVISKSFETLGLLAVVSIVVIAAGRFIESRATAAGNMGIIEVPNPSFPTIRRSTLGILIASAVLLAFLGVLAIWDVIADKQVLYKSLGSLAILGFSALIIVMTCLEREGNPKLGNKSSGLPIGLIVVLGIIGYIVLTFSRAFW